MKKIIKFSTQHKNFLVIIILVVGLLFIVSKIYYSSLKVKVIDHGSKFCRNDDECTSIDGCDAGCWNKKQLPKVERPYRCGTAGPPSCKCVNNTCEPQWTIDEIQFTDLSKNLDGCISTDGLQDKEFIINTQDEYNTLLEFRSPSPPCESFVLPEIDFSQNTLLGKFTSGGGCRIEFERQVYRDDTNKEIIYSIKVIEEGKCKVLRRSMSWVTVPKIPSDYNVIFDLK